MSANPAWVYLDHNATTPVLPEVPPAVLHSSFNLHPSLKGGAWRLHGFRRSRVAGPARFWGFPLPNA